MKNKRVAMALMTALSVASVADAHEGRAHLKGAVETITEDALVIRSLEGKPVSLRLTDETTYQAADGTNADRNWLRPGLRVVVEGVENDGDGVRAETVLLARPPKSPRSADAPHAHAKGAH